MTTRGLIVGFVVLSALPAGVLLARPERCYELFWFNSKTTCEGGCGVTYTVCPGAVLCDVSNAGGHPGPITVGPYPCVTYIGGTGTCPDCAGGTLVTANVTTNCPQQTCPPPCDTYKVPEE